MQLESGEVLSRCQMLTAVCDKNDGYDQAARPVRSRLIHCRDLTWRDSMCLSKGLECSGVKMEGGWVWPESGVVVWVSVWSVWCVVWVHQLLSAACGRRAVT